MIVRNQLGDGLVWLNGGWRNGQYTDRHYRRRMFFICVALWGVFLTILALQVS